MIVGGLVHTKVLNKIIITLAIIDFLLFTMILGFFAGIFLTPID